ncbi:MAG: methyltransferase domain-containing protein [Candidatus Lokiarchaeota archaeon]|nr:methyltransferase domain-containing protein [Candidatus Lokiarchaeota archaeon]
MHIELHSKKQRNHNKGVNILGETDIKYSPYEDRLRFIEFAGVNGKKVLDIGANKAKMSRILATHFNCKIVCIDPDEKKIEIAKKYTEDDGLGDKIEFKLADARKMPFQDNEFEISLCYSLLHHVQKVDRRKVVEELFRVTKEIVMISDLHKKGAKIYDAYIHPTENHYEMRLDFNWLIPIIKENSKNVEEYENTLFHVFKCII